MEINIVITDVKPFASVAFILDQDRLLNKILDIRPYWGLSKAFVPYNQFDIWYNRHKDDFGLTPEVKNYWGSLPDFSGTQNELIANQAIVKEIIYSNPIDLELEYLQRKNGIPPQLKRFMLKAIVCNEVRLSDWENEKNKEKFDHDDNFFKIPNFEKLYVGGKKPEIIRDRIWWWESRKGKTPLQIATETSYKGKWIPAEDYRKNVDNAISRYELFLKSQGTFMSL